jgi:aminoglycoside phosphotransferase family enzyme/predicted kinase
LRLRNQLRITSQICHDAGMDDPLPPLIAALLEPARYLHKVELVELVQTHISWVLLAGEFAYKIKKPVCLSFLDFSSLAKRRRYCLEELRLNQRFASDIYLAVVEIFGEVQAPLWHGSGEPIEYAVKMRRFDEQGRLDRLCDRGELHSAHLSDLAASVAAFHDTASRATADSGYGRPDAVLRAPLDNFAIVFPLMADPTIEPRLRAMRAWTEDTHRQLTRLMLTRLADGWVRECHGDLHLANMVLIDGHVRLFDCLEFSESLRWIDISSEIAFTYVDLLAHAQPGLANWFLNEVLSCSGDYQGLQLLPFYAVYRAMVRAKVAALRAGQMHGDVTQVLSYIGLAEQLTQPHNAQLLITHGLSGCGKTYLTDMLLQSDHRQPTLRLRSDVERKRLHGLTANINSRSLPDDGIYNGLATQQTYDHLLTQAETLLRAGWSVIVDATFLRQVDRNAFARLAENCGVDFGILAPHATPAQLRERILSRASTGQDASEATLAVLARQIEMVEPLTELEQQKIRTDVPAAGA